MNMNYCGSDEVMNEIVNLKVELGKLTTQVCYLENSLVEIRGLLLRMVEQRDSKSTRWMQVLIPVMVSSFILLVVELVRAWGNQ